MNVSRHAMFWIVAAAAVAATVVLLRDILLPFVAEIALAYLLDPVVEQIERLGVNRTIATLGIVGLFIIGVGGVMVQVTPLLGTEVADFIEKVPQYIEKLQAFANNPGRPWLRKIIGEGLSEAEQSSGQLTSVAADWIPTFLRSLWSDSRALMSILSLMVVTPIVTIYLLMDWKRLIAAIDGLIPAAQHETVLALSGELNDTISGFLRGQGTICLVLALYYASALRLTRTQPRNSDRPCRRPHQFHSLSRVAHRARAVAVRGGAPVLAELDDDFGRARNLPRGQAIADYVLSPYLIASQVQLNPVWIMFAIAAFGYLFGFVGLLIAVPLAAAIGVVIRFAMRQYQASQLEPAAAPATVVSAPEPSGKKTSFWRRWREKT